MAGGTAKHEGYLPYELGYLTPEMVETAKKELNETEETRKEFLEHLRNLLENEDNLYVRTDDNFLLAFLRGRKYNVQRAFASIQNLYHLRDDYRHIGSTNDNEPVHDELNKNLIGFLPYRDKRGSVILVIKVGMWDPEETPNDIIIWTMSHCMMFSIEDPATQVAGYNVIMDMSGFGSKHMMLFTLENVKLFVHSIQSCFPGRYKEVHLIRAPRLFSIAYSILYPFLHRKLRQRIFVYGSNLKSLHSKISPSILPSDFGGELGPFDNKPWHDLLLAKNEFCLQQRLYGYK